MDRLPSPLGIAACCWLGLGYFPDHQSAGVWVEDEWKLRWKNREVKLVFDVVPVFY